MKVWRRLCLFFLWIFFSLTVDGQGRDISIYVAVTSDVHARLFPYDFVNDRPSPTSMASIMYMLETVRSRQSGNLILLDNGDLLQGTPAAYYANFVQESKTNLFSRVMNLMKYDAATIGNHDIEAGPKVYNRLKEEFDFPWLGANILDAATGEPYFVPYTIIRRSGIRVAVLGLTTPSIPAWLPRHLWEGLAFQDMAEAAAIWVRHIREVENPDAVIGLFHSGFGPINPSADDHPLENAAAYIARNVPGFDVIFTGHDHRLGVEMVTNTENKEVLVLRPGHFAENLAVAELVFERNDKRSVAFITAKGELVANRNIAPSPGFFKSFEKDITEILLYSNQQVGRLSTDIQSNDALFGPSPLASLVHHVQLELTGADISLTAPLAFNETIRAGMLHVRDFFRLYEYENYLYTMELTGWEVQDFLEYSYGLWLNTMRDADDQLLMFRLNEEGRIAPGTAPRAMLRHPFYSFDSAAGIRYTVDVSKPVGSRVHIISMEDGQAFDIDKTYRVAVNSYRGSGGGGHLTLGAGIPHHELPGRITATTETDLRSAMIKHFMEMKAIEFREFDNWEIVPAEWKEKGRSKALEMLSGNSVIRE